MAHGAGSAHSRRWQAVRALLRRLVGTHDAAAARVESALGGWLPSLLARLVIGAVLFGYFLMGALAKFGEGLAGFVRPGGAAYAEYLPAVLEAYGGDAAAIPILPWGLLAALATHAEFLLPGMVVLGLATRAAALGMIVLILAQTAAAIAYRATEPSALFDADPSGVLDERTIWLVPPRALAIRGPGRVSVDAWLEPSLRRWLAL